jgi:hypothetical protein
VLEHPLADRLDQAEVLGERQEAVGAEQAELGVAPANQRLEPGDHPGPEAEDRLVDERQLPALDRTSQLDLQLEALHDLGVHSGLERLVAPLSA